MRRLTVQIGRLALALTVCAWIPGCASFCLPEIDPSGERIFLDPSATPRAAFQDMPRTDRDSNRVGLVVCPRATVAPVGSEVVLLAGVRGPDEYLRTNERVEWMIDPGSVGQFVDVDKGSWTDAFVGDFTRAKKIDNCFAVNTTSRRLLRLTRGTPDESDDVEVLKGQAWVTLTSAREGTSDVTVFCPGVSPWQARTEMCKVHWVDAQWSFPSLAIAESGGRQLLTTSVTRQTDGVARCGWIVRYEIVGGPPAAFAPDGSQVVEVSTDAEGKATVELFQTEAQAGTSKISIQVIRPAGLGCPDQQIVIGRTCLAQTWSAPDLGVRVTGPAVGSVGSNLGFRIEVSNPGDMATDGITLSAQLPAGLSYVSASPVSEGTGSNLRWSIGRLAAGEVRSIAVDLRSLQAGSHEICAQATAANGLSARSCATVATDAAEITVEILGPTEAAVGEDVTHQVVVSNRARVPANDLIITDRRDPGLDHQVAKLQIEKALGNLGPMESQTVTITFRVQQAGQLCHTVEVSGAGGLHASRRACIQARQPSAPQPAPGPITPQPPTTQPEWIQPEQPSPDPVTPPPITSPPRIEIKATFADDPNKQNPIYAATAGDTVVLMLDVASLDGNDLTGLTVDIQFDDALKPLFATQGYEFDGSTFSWQDFAVRANELGRVAISCKCEKAATSACFYARVVDANGQPIEQKACIPISAAQEPPPGPGSASALDLKINANLSPVSQGSTFSYRVLVTNQSTYEDRDVRVTVSFPPGLTPQKWRTRGPSRFRIDAIDNKVVFEAVPSLAPRDQLVYTIYVSADRLGDYTVQADAISQIQATGVSAQDSTVVNTGF